MPFWLFFRMGSDGRLCPVNLVLNNPSQELKNSFFWDADLSLERLEGKTKRAHFLKVQSDRITVWLESKSKFFAIDACGRTVHCNVVRNLKVHCCSAVIIQPSNQSRWNVWKSGGQVIMWWAKLLPLVNWSSKNWGGSCLSCPFSVYGPVKSGFEVNKRLTLCLNYLKLCTLWGNFCFTLKLIYLNYWPKSSQSSF